MVKQELEILKNGQYSNLNLKPKLNKGLKGLDDGNHIIVEKVFAEGYEYISKTLKDYNDEPLKSYSCKVLYNGEEVTFWLNAKEHEVFKDIGGIGDNVKISLKKEPTVNKFTGVEMLINRLYFEEA